MTKINYSLESFNCECGRVPKNFIIAFRYSLIYDQFK